MRNGEIVLLASDMEHVWRKWHSAAGHPGVRAMMLRIQQVYYYCGNLQKWIVDRKGRCDHCNSKVMPKLSNLPPATISSTRPFERVLVDHSAISHVDVLMGATKVQAAFSSCCIFNCAPGAHTSLGMRTLNVRATRICCFVHTLLTIALSARQRAHFSPSR
jgi:hypothetical protein